MKARPYRMTSRAAAAEETGRRILDAMLAAFAAQPYGEIRLEDVATAAGVTVQTVIRRFGGKDGAMTATVARELAGIAATRAAAMGAQPRQTIDDLVDHYEVYGALILKVYAERDQVAGLSELADAGRDHHLGWCRAAFDAHIDGAGALRTRRLAQLTALCDATTWRILRADLGLDPAETKLALAEMVLPLLRP